MTDETCCHELKFLGVWQIPPKDMNGGAQEVFGVATFSVDKGGTLELMSKPADGMFGDHSPLPQYEFLSGHNQKGECITLFNCQCFNRERNWTGNSFTETLSFRFTGLSQGKDAYRCKQDFCFDRIGVCLSELPVWLGLYQSAETKENGDYIVLEWRKQIPKNIPLYADDKVEISVVSSLGGNSIALGGAADKMDVRPMLSIVSKSGDLPYYGVNNSFEYYIQAIHAILILFTNTYEPFDKCYCWKKLSLEKTDLYVYQTSGEIEQDGCFSFYQPYSYEAIKTCLPEFMSQYLGEYSKISPQIWELALFNKDRKGLDNHTLANLVYVFEGLVHRLSVCNKKFIDEDSLNPDKILFQENFSKCQHLLSDKILKNWFKERCSWNPRLKSKLSFAFSHLSSVVDLFDDNSKLIDFIADSRNHSAHGKATNSLDKSIPMAFWFTDFLRVFVFYFLRMPQDMICKEAENGRCYMNQFREQIEQFFNVTTLSTR